MHFSFEIIVKLSLTSSRFVICKSNVVSPGSDIQVCEKVFVWDKWKYVCGNMRQETGFDLLRIICLNAKYELKYFVDEIFCS